MDKTGKLIKWFRYFSEETTAALQANDVQKLKFLNQRGHQLGLSHSLDGNNILHLAIQYSQNRSTMEAFEYLLTLPEVMRNKDNLNFKEYSPLMCAFSDSKDNPYYAIRLIECDCELSVRSSNGNSVLHLAVRNDWPEVMELLIEKGVDIDRKNDTGATALHFAAENQSTDLIWMLLFYGADPNISRIFVDESTTGFIQRNLTFFDIVYSHQNATFLDWFSNFDKTFSLSTFVKAMENGVDSFYELVDITCDINYINDDLDFFLSRVFAFNSKLLKRFVEEYGFIVKDVFRKSKLLHRLFSSFNPSMLQNVCNNLLILLESDISSTVIDELNESQEPLLMHLIQYFTTDKNQIELLTQVLCCFLSYGANLTPEAMDELYLSFGYSELFKMMLHMNIAEKKPYVWSQDLWPIIIYDMDIDLDNFLSNLNYYEATSFHLNKYCTAPAISHLRFPSLAELARNASRKAIMRKFQPKNSMQLYTILYRLPIGRVYQDIIAYARPIYAMNSFCSESDDDLNVILS